MTKRARIPPAVDDADVDVFIESLKDADFEKTTPEFRAEVVSRIALDYARVMQMTPAWGKELARRVRKRALWYKPSH